MLSIIENLNWENSVLGGHSYQKPYLAKNCNRPISYFYYYYFYFYYISLFYHLSVNQYIRNAIFKKFILTSLWHNYIAYMF